jgi:hypothetical protein
MTPDHRGDSPAPTYWLSLFDCNDRDQTRAFDGEDGLAQAMRAVDSAKLDPAVVGIWLSRLGDSELIFVGKPIRRNADGEWEDDTD